MTLKTKIIIACVIYIVVIAGWGKVITEFYGKGSTNYPSATVEKSKKKGVFIEELSITPSLITVGNTNLKIQEIWLEKENDLLFILPIIPRIIEYPIYTNKDGYNICFRFSQDIPDTFHDWMFVIEGKGNSFGMINGEYFYETIENNNWESINVLLTDNWHFKNSKKLMIKRKG